MVSKLKLKKVFIASFLLALALSFTLVGCGAQGKEFFEMDKNKASTDPLPFTVSKSSIFAMYNDSGYPMTTQGTSSAPNGSFILSLSYDINMENKSVLNNSDNGTVYMACVFYAGKTPLFAYTSSFATKASYSSRYLINTDFEKQCKDAGVSPDQIKKVKCWIAGEILDTPSGKKYWGLDTEQAKKINDEPKRVSDFVEALEENGTYLGETSLTTT